MNLVLFTNKRNVKVGKFYMSNIYSWSISINKEDPYTHLLTKVKTTEL